MVSLRGSKYGSRVAMLCCNPAMATRPGPPSILPRYGNNGHRGGGYGGFRLGRRAGSHVHRRIFAVEHFGELKAEATA